MKKFIFKMRMDGFYFMSYEVETCLAYVEAENKAEAFKKIRAGKANIMSSLEALMTNIQECVLLSKVLVLDYEGEDGCSTISIFSGECYNWTK